MIIYDWYTTPNVPGRCQYLGTFGNRHAFASVSLGHPVLLTGLDGVEHFACDILHNQVWIGEV